MLSFPWKTKENIMGRPKSDTPICSISLYVDVPTVQNPARRSLQCPFAKRSKTIGG